MVGFVVAFVAIIAIILITGPSPSDVYTGMVKDALGIREVLTTPFPFPAGAALDWAIAAVVAAAIASSVRLAPRRPAGLWTGLLRALAGLVILCSVAHIIPLGLNPTAGNPMVVPMLLVWVAAIPPAGAVETALQALPAGAAAAGGGRRDAAGLPGRRAARWGSPRSPSSSSAPSASATPGPTWRPGARPAAARVLATSPPRRRCVAIALPAVFGLNAIVLPGMSGAVTYHELPKLDLPGPN